MERTLTPVAHAIVSPVTGRTIETVSLWTAADICRRLEELSDAPRPDSREEVLAFVGRLHEQLSRHREGLIETTILETGFIRSDSRDIVDGSLEFLRDFRFHAEPETRERRVVPHSYSSPNTRAMHLLHRPYEWVASMVPQNASLALGLTIIASALYAGSRVLLRPSLQCGSSGALLADMVEQSQPPAGSVLVTNCHASDFLRACYASDRIELIHYIGSNLYAPDVLADSLKAGKHCLLDGQGNGILYVDATFPLEDAVRLIVGGATRFNGETCTSVNGVLVDPRLHAGLREALIEEFSGLTPCDPSAHESQIGPLFSREHAANLAKQLRQTPHHRVLCGGIADGAYFHPAVVEGVTRTDALVREGMFGPALWIQPIDERELIPWLRANAFPLSDTLLSMRPELIGTFAHGSRAARICVNEDPSIESMFEPWGGYPPSGMNPVSNWIDKYRQPFQLDGSPGALGR